MLGYPLFLIALAAAPQGAAPAGASNPCVTCHEGLAAPQAAAHSFTEWRASAHGATVTCDRCHGGDTTTTEQEAAHRNVFPASDYRSSVYRTHVPATCGTCHQQELGYFVGSLHAGRLTTGGRGPSCVTCHGSMAIRTPTAADLDTSCTTCHRAGGAAPAAVIDTARALLARMRRADSTRQVAETAAAQLADARARARAQARVQQARDLLQRSRQGWHAFDLAMVRDLLRRADSLTAPPARRE